MQFQKIKTKKKFVSIERRSEKLISLLVRKNDHIRSRLGLGGRKANYDDLRYEFLGGTGEKIRKKHYDKSLHLLWKAEEQAPFLPFKDCSRSERTLLSLAEQSLSEEEKVARNRISLPEYKALLNREYTQRQKQAIVNILSAIGHGEAYAWLVSAELLGEVKSTGGRAALTMQVLEEAKHFVVLRELLRAFDVPIPRQSAWEYLFLEGVYKAKGLEKFFGMNVAVEGIALGLFGMMSHLPGLEILRMFHLDESRHTGLPSNYFSEFPMTEWQKRNPIAQWRRFKMILPALALIVHLEEDLAELGVDSLEFGGSVLRKICLLAERNGFHMFIPRERLLRGLNKVFNEYSKLTRDNHEFRDFMVAETTRGKLELGVEAIIFGDSVVSPVPVS